MKVVNFHNISMPSSSSSDRCQVVLQNAARRELGPPVDPQVRLGPGAQLSSCSVSLHPVSPQCVSSIMG